MLPHPLHPDGELHKTEQFTGKNFCPNSLGKLPLSQNFSRFLEADVSRSVERVVILLDFGSLSPHIRIVFFLSLPLTASFCYHLQAGVNFQVLLLFFVLDVALVQLLFDRLSARYFDGFFGMTNRARGERWVSVAGCI